MPVAGAYSEFLDVKLLERLSSLELRARFLVSGFLAGMHRAPFRGNSVEFKEYRDYYPGDELKFLDWKAYARTDRLHIKLREEETTLVAGLLLDASASMAYRSSGALLSKWDFARSLAAAFSLLLQQQRDAAGLAFLGGSLAAVQRPGGGAGHYHRLMRHLHREASEEASNIAGCLKEYLPLVRRRSLILVFSDFYEEPAALRRQLALMRNMNCEVLLFHILDPAELDFDFAGTQVFRELESHGRLELSPELVRKAYQDKVGQHVAAIQAACASCSCEYQLLRTDAVPLQALGCYLARRVAMR